MKRTLQILRKTLKLTLFIWGIVHISICYTISLNQFDEEPYKTWKAKLKGKPEFKSICFNPTHNLSIKMKAALKLYRENIQYIEN